MNISGPVNTRRLRHGDTELYIETHGGGPRPPVICVHGGPGMDHTYMKPWFDAVAADRAVVYYDQRGCGRSNRPDPATCTMDAFVADLDAVRATVGAERFVLAGSSFGGFVGLSYAVSHPDRLDRLVLVGTAPSGEFSADASENAAKATQDQQDAVAALADGRIHTDEEFARAFARFEGLYFHRYDQRAQAALADTIFAWATYDWVARNVFPHYDVRPRLGEIHVPTIVCVGEHDWVCPVGQSERIAADIPSAQLIRFRESGHMPFIEESAAFAAAVATFLA
jgi:proline iminopeptidase